MKADWKRLESFHLRCQRRILGIHWSDFITNAEVCIRLGLQSIQSMVHRRRLSLFGHVARMPDNVPAKAVLHMACDVRDGVPPFPNRCRLWGRPHITWLHQICSELQTVACQQETPSTVPRMGPCGERTLRPPRPCVDDDDKFCSSPETKSENRLLCYLIYRTSVPVYCIPIGMKLPKVSVSPNFYSKNTPKGA